MSPETSPVLEKEGFGGGWGFEVLLCLSLSGDVQSMVGLGVKEVDISFLLVWMESLKLLIYFVSCTTQTVYHPRIFVDTLIIYISGRIPIIQDS